MKQFCILVFSVLITQQVLCQPWIPLGSDEQTSNSIALTAAPTIFSQLSADGVPYISYIDDAAVGGNNLGDFKTHSKRFINGQWSFAGDAISPEFPGSDFFPIALDGNVPYVAYVEPFNPAAFRNKLSVRRLNSNTNKWEIVGEQGLSDASAGGTAIAADNGKIYVAYNDEVVDSKVTVRFFDNANAADGWKNVGTPGISNNFVLGITLTVDNGILYISYLDFGDNFAHVKKFNGAGWEDVGTNNPAGGLQVLVRNLKFDSHHTPYIAFVDVTGTAVVRNLNAANAWVTTGGQSFATAVEEPLSLTILHDVPFIAFGKKDNNNVTQLNVKGFNSLNNTWPDVGNQPVTASPVLVANAVLMTASNNKLLTVFRNLNGGIFAKTFDATIVVPVTLTSFHGIRQNNKSLLQWHTAMELDNKLFEVEHSTDAINFTGIGIVDAKTPADVAHDYEFIHDAPVNGVNFYRLKQVDNNGHFTYSNIISITFGQQQQPITLFPNPVKDILHTEYPAEGKKEIIIRNAEGKELIRLKSTARTIDINIKDLPEGTYFISLYGDKLIETRSFVK